MHLIKQKNLIQGSGGGGGKGGGGAARAAVEAPDSLRGIQYAATIDLLTEGRARGPRSDILKSLLLNDVVIQNEDGSMNFTGVTVDYRLGTADQLHMPGFPSVEATTATGIQVKQSTPATINITNPDVDMVRINMSVPALTRQDTTSGDLSGNSVEIAFELQVDGGGFLPIEVPRTVIEGKTVSRYPRSYMINLPKPAVSWDIRIKRVSTDDIPTNEQKSTWFDSYTEIIDTKLQYVNSCIVGVQVDASQFSSVPTRGFYWYGVELKVPTNYDPITRVYTGIWDGTFKTAWTNNPVWCYYAILTHTRFGIGQFVQESQIDKWALYTIAKYCDEMVDDGFGGLEPRFTCNVYLQTQEDAYRVLASMASVFRAMSYWSTGTVVTVQDAPSIAEPIIYAPANVVGGSFQYQGSSRKARHTVAVVMWNDPNQHFKQVPEYVEDREGIARYGIVPINTVAFGCTSRGQAHRWGRWLLYTERMETQVVSFRVGFDGILSPPGTVIQIANPVRAGLRLGGRALAATASQVTLDAQVTIEAGRSYTLSCVLPDGSVEKRVVDTAPAVTDVLHVSSPFTTAPQELAMWVLVPDNVGTETFRVISVTEQTNGFEITALAHNPSKYGHIEQGLVLEQPSTSIINVGPPGPVSNIGYYESAFRTGPETITNRLTISWEGVSGKYRVSYKRDTDNWVTPPDVDRPSIDLDNLEAGHYVFMISQGNLMGQFGPARYLEVDLVGKDIEPELVPDVTGLELSGLNSIDNVFEGQDAKVEWRRSSVYFSHEFGEDVAGEGALDVYFNGYVVRVSTLDGRELREEITFENTFTYTFLMNWTDTNGVPVRDLVFEVWARGRSLQLSLNPASLTVSNPPLPLPVGMELSAGLGTLVLKYPEVTAPDNAGLYVWVSTSAVFIPGPENLAFSGMDNPAIIKVAPGFTYYVVYALVDTFGLDGATYSPVIAQTVNKIEESDLSDELNARIDTAIGEGLAEDILAEQEARIAADIAEANARAEAIFAESQARAAAIIAETEARLLAEAALGTRITEEESIRELADEAEATSRNTLAVQLRGDYTGTDLASVSVGLIASERNARVTAVDAEATQRNLLAVTVNSNTAAILDEQEARIDGDEAEATNRNTLAVQIRGDYTGTDAASVSSGLIFSERTARVTADEAEATARENLAVSIGDDIDAAVNAEAIVRAGADSAEATQRNTLAVQMRGDYTGTDVTAVTTGLIHSEREVRVAADAAEAYQRSLLALTVGDNTAAIQDEEDARIAADSAEATTRNTLAVQMRGAYEGTDVASVSSGLIYSERQARVTADEAEASARTALGVTVGENLSAAIGTEQLARINADNAEATARDSLAVQVRGDYTGTDAASLTTGLVYSERQARITAVGAEAYERSLLAVSLGEDITAAVETEAGVRASETGALGAQWTVKTQVNNYVAGFGLATTLNDAVPFSTFRVLTDAFVIGHPTGSDIIPFSVSGGITYIDTAYIRAADITSAHIQSLDAVKIVADNLSAITVNVGTLVMDEFGHIRGGMTSSTDPGSGFFFGYEGINYVMSMRTTGGNHFLFTEAGVDYRGPVKDTKLFTPGSIPVAVAHAIVDADPTRAPYAGVTDHFKVKEIHVNRDGVVRVKFDMRWMPDTVDFQPTYAYAVIRKNDVPVDVGTPRPLDWSQTGWYSYTEDIAVSNGDKLQLYVANNTSLRYHTRVRNFGVYSSFSTGTLVTIDDPYPFIAGETTAPVVDTGSNDSLNPHSEITMADGSYKWLDEMHPGDMVKGQYGPDEVIGLRIGALGDKKYVVVNGKSTTTAGHLYPMRDGGWAAPDPGCYAKCSYGEYKTVKARRGMVTVFSEICHPDDVQRLVPGMEILREDGEWEVVTSVEWQDHVPEKSHTIAVLLRNGKLLYSDGYAVGTLA